MKYCVETTEIERGDQWDDDWYYQRMDHDDPDEPYLVIQRHESEWIRRTGKVPSHALCGDIDDMSDGPCQGNPSRYVVYRIR